ncbi:MAG: WD40/YVTN/BNR-like repeat-containing protein, partial [Candidatus Aminicenantaceae bacterium]
MKKILVLSVVFCVLCSGLSLWAQTGDPFDEELLKAFPYRELGPARQGGRILRIEVPEQEPYTFYVVTSTGGLWKTSNNGTTFEELFLQENTPAIGDLAIAPSDPNILYVGTGTAASGRITLRGDGVYKSTDAGQTWTHIGLEKTIHIGRIAVHPQNPDIVYVAALGYHFTFNPDRGLYKSENGGQTWERIHFISEKVGIVEVVLDPKDPD